MTCYLVCIDLLFRFHEIKIFKHLSKNVQSVCTSNLVYVPIKFFVCQPIAPVGILTLPAQSSVTPIGYYTYVNGTNG